MQCRAHAPGRLRRRVLLGRNRKSKQVSVWLAWPRAIPMGLDDRAAPGPNPCHAPWSRYEWAAIKRKLPNKALGVPRVNDRRVLNEACDLEHPGAICRMPSVPTPLASTASFVGGELPCGVVDSPLPMRRRADDQDPSLFACTGAVHATQCLCSQPARASGNVVASG
jgi:hypothetical protein